PPDAPLFGRGGSRLGGGIGRRVGLALGHRGHRRFGKVDRYARSGLADDQFAPAQILGIRLVGRFLAFAAGGEREGEAGGRERQQRAGGELASHGVSPVSGSAPIIAPRAGRRNGAAHGFAR